MLDSNLIIAIKAAIKAGEEIMRIYEQEVIVEKKDDQSPLTLADRNANTIINELLCATDYPIISEENRNSEYSERKEWTSCWIVDPLDGTKEFIKKNGEFTVNIALATRGITQLGVIYVPVSRELYFTSTKKDTAYKAVIGDYIPSATALMDIATKLEPLDAEEKPIKIVGSRSHLNQDTQDFVDELKNSNEVEIVSKGSSLKFCLVAEGKAHKYPRYAPTMEWDTAAGQAICEAAGLQVIDKNTGKPLLYNKENLLNPYFLVTA